MKRASLALVLVVAIIASAFAVAPAMANPECDGYGSAVRYTMVPVSAGDATFYVELREVGGFLVSDSPYIWSIWLYEETNGIESLQRGGSSWIDPADIDPCNDDPTTHDQVWY